MAQIYTIKCPKCKCVFNVCKGVLMSWDFSKPIPKHLRDETPFNCPECKYKMRVRDKDFRENVIEIMNFD